MTWPKQSNPISSRREAKAPYNFVPLPENVRWAPQDPPAMDRYHEGRYTGWLSCTLTTSSPLYIRSGLTLEEAEEGMEAKDRPDFFYADPKTREPVIPGSSLRGMLRTLVEIVTSSKVQPVTDDQLVYRAVADTSSLGDGYRDKLLRQIAPQTYEYRMQAGYMREQNDGWNIVPAQTIRGQSFVRIERDHIPTQLRSWHTSRNANVVFVDVSPVGNHSHNRGRVQIRYAKVRAASNQATPNHEKAVLVQTGSAPRKHMEFVFGLPDKQLALPISDDVIATYREQITDEQKRLLGPTAALRDWQPVFYLQEGNDVFFFGHAMMFRLPYDNTPRDCVPPPLRDTEQTDFTEALFGYVDEDAEERPVNVAGRVSVCDAVLEPDQEEIWLSEDPVVPEILASPKPTTFQHYLVQTATGRRNLRHYNSPTPKETVIRGHKLYWHKGDVSREQFEVPDRPGPDDTQHTTIKPIRSGVRFHFRIHFENLSPEELGAMLWILGLAQENDLRLKLGMGKPLGLGAVRIQHDLRLTERTGEEGRYDQLFGEQGWAEGRMGRNKTNRELEKAVESFERWMLPDVGTAKHQLERIRRLRALLSWPGPSPRQTRYLRIEPRNEYRTRPVLPDPLHVVSTGDEAPTQSPRRERRARQTDLKTGRVKWFSQQKGYGFIAVDDEREDAFVHHSDVRGTQEPKLREGQRVRFSVVQGEKGPRAQDVQVIQ